MDKFNIIFIDDDFKEMDKDPFVFPIKEENKDANIHVFLDANEGLDFILKNLNTRMIVFLDLRFGSDTYKGINVLKQIREKTSLLFVVMMSANQLNSLENSYLMDLINEDFIWFFNKNTQLATDALKIIDKVKRLWVSRFDCILEHWIMKHPENFSKRVFREAGKEYTWKDILKELRKQTEIGKSIEQMINQYYIYQVPELSNG